MGKAALSAAEWKIMQKLWDSSPLTLRGFQNALADTGWSKHAIISFLKRLEQKGFIKVIDKQPAREYVPVLLQNQAVKDEMNHVIDKFGGNIGLIGSALVNSQMTEEELSELLKILEQAKKGGE